MKRYAWLVFVVLGLLILLFAAYNAIYIPALDPADPDEGWVWLTTDPEIIDYIKFNFQVQGMWQMGYGLLVMATAVGGLRQKQRWAWYGLWSVPLVLLLMATMMPWTIPVLIVPWIMAVASLVIARGKAQ